MPTTKPHVRMRRTRWDQKHEEDPVPSSSSWDNPCRSNSNQVTVDWNHESTPVVESVGRSREHINTPHPLDYSRQSDKRDGNSIQSKELERQKEAKDHRKGASKSVADQQPPLINIPPPLLSYAGDLHHLYAGSNQNAQLSYQSQISWNHPSQSYYPNSSYHPGMFNVKWWEDVDPEDSHHNMSKDKFESSRSGQWPKLHKSNDRSSNYDFNRRFGRYQNMSLDRSNRLYRDQRPYLHTNNLNPRYNKYESNSQNLNRVWRNNHNGRQFNSMRQDFPSFYDWNQNNINQGSYVAGSDKIRNNYPKITSDVESLKNKSTDCGTTETNKAKEAKPKKVLKKNCKKNSTAEKAKKKALANAANKLKMTFFAAKKKPFNKSVKKQKVQSCEKSDSSDKNEANIKDKVQDLSIPKSIAKYGTSLEHDIDIKFSAQEWESVGRGEGGTRNLLALPGSKDSKDDADNSDSDSVQTVEDFDSRELTDMDNENSDSFSEEEELNIQWNSMNHLSPKPIRRRHVSETCNASNFMGNQIPNLSKARRMRSFSTSQVEERSPTNCSNQKAVSSNLKNMLVKQLLTMDKKSLVELVNNPKSGKAQYMMSHFMKMHKVALSHKLNQIRFKNTPSALNDGENDDDLQILLTISPAQLENLSPDILQQVKDILALEESGNEIQMWEEVSLSLSDLISGLENNSGTFREKVSGIQTIFEDECMIKNNETCNAETGEDPDCQIVTPPPRRPATTITIPDSDTDNGSEGKLSYEKCSKNQNSHDSASSSSSDDPVSSFIKPADIGKHNSASLIHQSTLHVIPLSPLSHFVPPLPIEKTDNGTSNCIEKDLVPSLTHFIPPHPIEQPSVPAFNNIDRATSPLPHFVPPLPIEQSPAPTPNAFDCTLSPFIPPLPIKQSPAPTPNAFECTLSPFVPPLPIKQSPAPTPNDFECAISPFVPPIPIKQSPAPTSNDFDRALSPFVPPLPIKQSPAPTPNDFDRVLSPFVTPLPIKQSLVPSASCLSEAMPLPPRLAVCSPPHPSLSQSCFRPLKRLKRNSGSKDKSGESLLVSNSSIREEIQLPTHSLKVKQERPSPMIECGYCLHPPRSPHTTQCGFSFGIQPPPPVALLPGSARALGTSSQRAVPHLPSSSMSRLFKQEKTVSFVSLNVNRPSSEERPKNPAPPDTANSEPPSPLPIPPPQPSLHPPPSRPLIFSPDGRFPESSRSSSPLSQQHTPRIIKSERQTPQYICCCMRNECERNNGSRPSAEFRRTGTPLNQLCDVANRLTPHLYKIEPPYIPRSRSRTPHSNILGMFPGPQSPRCISTIINNSQNGNEVNKVSVGVQTTKAVTLSPDGKRSFIPRISLARAVTPFCCKMDQMTSTDDLSFEDAGSVLPILDATFSRNEESSFSEESKLSKNSEIKEVTHQESSTTAHILMNFSKQEKEIFQRLEVMERKSKELADERFNLTKCLENINNLRSEELKKLVCERPLHVSDTATEICAITHINNTNTAVNNNTEDLENKENSYPDSLYMVTSSQEISSLKRTDSPTESCSNDSEQHNIQGQRCTSSSLIVNEADKKSSVQSREQNDNSNQFLMSDSEEENKSAKTFQRSKIKFSLVQSCYRRQRMDSVSSSEEDIDKNIPNHPQHGMTNNMLGNISVGLLETKIEVPEVKQENESILNKFRINNRAENSFENELVGHNRKNSLSSSPQSPKIRNSSGSEHGYSLRSRGPPSELLDFTSDSQFSKDATLSSQEDHIDIIEEKPSICIKSSNKSNQDDEQADDELEKDDSESKNLSTHKLFNDNLIKRRKRKRKNKKNQINKCKKKNEIASIYQSESVHFQEEDETIKTNSKKDIDKETEASSFCKREETIFKAPQPHKSAILDLKVVGDFIFTASSDGTARLFDPTTGLILASYVSHTDSVTAIQVVGQPDFRPIAPEFLVITGSEDNLINVYDGKTGVLSKTKNTFEPVRCLAHRWGYLFIGTDGGCGIKWNLKDKKLGEKIQFCGKGITQLIAHIEGGRKVLVVSAKTTPIMVRDAMSGLFLRTLEYVQLTVYSAVFEGSLLYTGGADKNIYTYDFCSGSVKKTFNAGSAVSGLLLVDNHLIAICYDGYVRVFKLPNGELTHSIAVESSHKMYICSSLYKDQILLGNRNGEIVSCPIPNLCD